MPGDPGSIPDQEARFHMLQLKILCASNKDQEQPYICVCVCVCVYIYIYYIYM